jgi:hypothetical protein
MFLWAILASTHTPPQPQTKYNIISLLKRKKISSLLELDGAEHFQWLKGLSHEMKMGSLCAGWIDQNLECEALIGLNKTSYFQILFISILSFSEDKKQKRCVLACL